MLSRPQTTLLAFLALSSFAQAGWGDGRINDVLRRQDDTEISPSISVPSVSPSVSVPDTGSASPTPTPTPTPEETPTPTPSGSSSSPSAPPSSSSSPSSSQPPSSTSSAPEKTSSKSSVTEETTTPEVTPTPSVVRVTQTKTIDGNVVTSVSESTSTPSPTSSKTASLSPGSESSGGGMSSKTKSTVIGVVVGIGGAILLGGLAIVAWRIWGRRKNEEEGDDLMGYRPETSGHEKTGSSSATGSTNPFQSTLENYHNPSKQVNASSNF